MSEKNEFKEEITKNQMIHVYKRLSRKTSSWAWERIYQVLKRFEGRGKQAEEDAGDIIENMLDEKMKEGKYK